MAKVPKRDLEHLDVTRQHIDLVRKLLRAVAVELILRGEKHDKSKLESPERELFAEVNERLAGLEYGSDEYQQSLDDLKPALDHHYANNRHHPEHFPNGIDDMNLLDLIEMFCDWKAASSRQNNGNIRKSLEVNAERFQVAEQLLSIFENTVEFIDNAE